ncbi:MAG TPA: hypothetical protein VJ647_04500 [Chitinophagaceae bacterium]|nr:hypothetical protein [Chitinophagaceae bacterium]
MKPELPGFKDRIASLIRKDLTGSLSPSEQAVLSGWIAADPINKELYNQITLQYKKDVDSGSGESSE